MIPILSLKEIYREALRAPHNPPLLPTRDTFRRSRSPFLAVAEICTDDRPCPALSLPLSTKGRKKGPEFVRLLSLPLSTP